MASRRERNARRASAESSPRRRRERARALLIGTIVAALVGFGAGWLVRMRTARTPGERARGQVGELRERVRDATH